MPSLENAKHERFAQELAKGKTQEEAYREAGYVGDRTAASRLSTNVNIKARLSELLERAATRAEISVANLTERLMGIADLAQTTGVHTDADTGEVIATSTKHLSVARNAIMDVAKLNGLVIDKAVTAEAALEDMLDAIAGSTGGVETAH